MLNCKTVSKTMKNIEFFVTSQQETLKRKIREEDFTKAVLIDVCGCLKNVTYFAHH